MGLTKTLSRQSSPGQLWGLVDCNNFFASCEKLFRPDLADKPVVVLSSNDGCIIARSAEAKALGIKMGTPFFKIEDFLKANGVTVFSSNFALYGNISSRVMATLEEVCPTLEQYSVDEAFISMSGALLANVEEVAWELKRRTLRNVGIPVSVGIAPTRTLAKIANHLAKKGPGVVILRQDADFGEILAHTPLTEVWGIGPRQMQKCWADGIHTALQLTQARDAWIQQVLTIAGLNTVNELRGIPSVGEGLAPVSRKSIARSQSFGKKVTDRQILGEAICTFIARAAEDLRREGLTTKGLAVYIRTSRYDSRSSTYENRAQKSLLQRTADTNLLQKTALDLLAGIFRPGREYAKAGILFYDLGPAGMQQGNLLTMAQDDSRRRGLMETIDKINAKHGKQIKFGAEGMDDSHWHAQRKYLSPQYTTKWEDLPQVRC